MFILTACILSFIAVNSCKSIVINNWLKLQLGATDTLKSALTDSLDFYIKNQNLSVEQAEYQVVMNYLEKPVFSDGSYEFLYDKAHIIFDQNDAITKQFSGKTPKEAYGIISYNGGYHLETIIDGIMSGKNGTGYIVKNYKTGPEYVSWVSFTYNNKEYFLGIITPEYYILNQYNFDYSVRFVYLFIGAFLFILIMLSLFTCLTIYRNTIKINQLEKENEHHFQTITVLKEKLEINDQKIKNISIRDLLTGVYSRKFFDAFLLKMGLNIFLPVSILLIDINGLRQINNKYGYQSGDTVLIEISKIISMLCRDSDIIARYENDEFVVVMTNTDFHFAENLIKKIREEIYNKFKEKMFVNVSFGNYSKTTADEDIKAILEKAETNMILNKMNVKSSIKHTPVALLQKTLSERSIETSEHCERMEINAVKIGHAMDLGRSTIEELKLLAYLHDIGKIGIPDRILNKPSSLTDAEYEIIKSHPEIGYSIAMASPDLKQIAEYILEHHEKWDGSGYPNGLKGKEISIQARIIAIVDSYDVMSNDRVYRTAKSKEFIMSELKEKMGTQFDPEITQIFINILEEENQK